MSLFPNIKAFDLRTDLDDDRIIIDPNDDENELDGLSQYRNGGEGFAKWCEENIRVPIQYGDAGVETFVYLGEMPEEASVTWTILQILLGEAERSPV